MITLADLLFITNDSADVEILDNEGNTLLRGEASDLEHEVDEYEDAVVMDVYPFYGKLVICIEV